MKRRNVINKMERVITAMNGDEKNASGTCCISMRGLCRGGGNNITYYDSVKYENEIKNTVSNDNGIKSNGIYM